MKILKRNIFTGLFGFCFLLLVISHAISLRSYASWHDLMISTDSNASTFALPRSSVGTVKNTVAWDNGVVAFARMNDGSVRSLTNYITKADSEGLSVKYSAPTGYQINAVFIYLRYGAFNYMPSIGTYNMSFDVSSQFGHSYSAPTLSSIKRSPNVADIQNSYYLRPENWTSLSGDLYAHDVIINYTGSQYVNLNLVFQELYSNLDFTLHVNFTESTDSPMYTTAGTGSANSDYQEGINSSLSDLSSSVGEMSNEISEVTEAIQNLQGAMEPHYNNVLTQLHHITEQLHAFYDQIYNNIHLKEYALWQDIKTAIENIDLEVNVNLDKLKTSIDNMSTAVQNKLQSVTDTITGGFDNSGIEQNGNELDSSITEFEEAEQNVLESVNDSLNDFEFDADLSEYKNIVQVISDFLQELYDSSGGFKLVINLSLMLSVASIVIGVYRFKEGG